MFQELKILYGTKCGLHLVEQKPICIKLGSDPDLSE